MVEEDCMVAHESEETMEKMIGVQVCLHHEGVLQVIEDMVEVKIGKKEQGNIGSFLADGKLNEHLKVSIVECLEIEDADFCELVGALNDDDSHVHHIGSNGKKFFGYEGDNMNGTWLHGVYTFYGYTTMGVNEMGRNIMNSLECVDGALFKNEQEENLKCWLDDLALFFNTHAVEFRFRDEGHLAGMFSKGVYHEGEDSWWWQHDLLTDVITSVGKEHHLCIVFERNGRSYLSNIMQNHVFDPGGRIAFAHMKHGWRCSLKAKDSLPFGACLLSLNIFIVITYEIWIKGEIVEL